MGSQVWFRLAFGVMCVNVLVGCAVRQGAPSRRFASGVDQLSWMSGTWVNETSADRSEEHWMPPRGGTMVGMSRTVEGDKTAFFEFLRIEARPDGVYYIASPLGKGETSFRMVDGGACDGPAAREPWCIEFTNPTHDFPQRIIYRRLPGGRLVAVIEGMRAGQPAREEFRWRRERR